MEYTPYVPCRPLRFNPPIAVLTIIALVLLSFTSLSSFLVYSITGNEPPEYYFSLTFFQDIFDNQSIYMLYIVSLLIKECFLVAAPVLLFLYVFVFYKKNQASFLLPVILGLVAASFIFEFGVSYAHYLHINHEYFLHRHESIRFFEYFHWTSLLFYILCISSLALAAIFSYKKPANKVFLIIAVVINLSVQCFSSISSLLNNATFHISDGAYLFVIVDLLELIGFICFYTALLLLVLPKDKPLSGNNTCYTSPVNPAFVYSIPVNPTYGNHAPTNFSPMPPAMDPVTVLRQLKTDYESGRISAEEYQARIAQIIDQL